MRQLEGILGEDAFREGLRSTCARHRFGNATWPDLIALLDARTPEDLSAWSRAWVEEAGRPIVATELRVDERPHREPGVRPARSRRAARPRLEPAAPGDARAARRAADAPRVGSPEGRVDVPGARGLPAPHFVLPIGGGIGYGGFELDAASLTLPARASSRDSTIRSRAARAWSRSGNRCSMAGRRRRASSTSRCARCPARPTSRTCSGSSATRGRRTGLSFQRRTATASRPASRRC